MKKLVIYLLLLNASSSFAAVFTVTNTNDSGNGSLRKAIDDANLTAGTHSIAFNIPLSDPCYHAASGTWTINMLTSFNPVTRNNLTIDGFTQTSNVGNTNPSGPEIVLNGNSSVNNAFLIFNASGVTIRGFVISRFIIGIQINQLGAGVAQNNIIQGNYIGTNYNASDTAGNYIGIEIIGGPQFNLIGGSNPQDRNIVSGNEHIGIRVANANNNIITGNFVGTDLNGAFALRNYDGISIEGNASNNIIGGNTAAERNLVSGNIAYGIPVFGAGCYGNIVTGNFIGTDAGGVYAIPNTYGVLFDDGASYNRLGGNKTGEGNLISGNSGYGVFLYNNSTNADTVIGNLIGTDLSGNSALPNTIGLVIDGIPQHHLIDSNIISGNLQHGIVIHATGTDHNIITRNCIGTDISGQNPLPNNIDGIRIGEGPQHNIIGGSSGKGNIIAYNGGNGISIMTEGDYYNRISENSIFYNAGLGIDLYPIGVTANDAGDPDTGPNFTMNYPVITYAAYNSLSGNYEVQGNISTILPQTVTIELFLSDEDPSGYGEGIKYLTSVNPDNSGNFNTILTGVWGGWKITSTATDAAGNTSEFSASFTITGKDEFAPSEMFVDVYPVPAFDMIVLKICSNYKTAEIILFDEHGRVLINTQITDILSEKKIVIPVNKYPAGIYFLNICDDNRNITKKIIIEH